MSGLCAYLTDVEGNWDYFERYISISRVLSWENAGKEELRLRDGCEFVFGGDAVDKGNGDIRFLRAMLRLKKRYPDRVHLIVGNRDCNKLRFGTELTKEALRDAIDDRSFPYWLSEKERVTPAKAYEQEGGLDNTPANRLRWILKHTMGSDGAFERRRAELAILGGVEESEVPDEAVVSSYVDSVDPRLGNGALMLDYLRQGQIAYSYGSVLFVHGGLNKDNVGGVPGRASTCSSVDGWVRALNAFHASQVEEYVRAFPPRSGTFSYDGRAGDLLMDYGVPGGAGGKSVVYASFLKDGNATEVDPAVEDFMAGSGVNTVVAGHTPHGDCPLVISGDVVRVITADTSYSHFGHNSTWGVDNRGCAIGEVLIGRDGACLIHGILADSTLYDFKLSPPGQAGGDPYIGRKVPGGGWVKCRLSQEDADGKIYVSCLGEGRKLTHTRWTENELASCVDTAWTPDPDDDASSEGISALQEKVSRIAERNAASSYTSKRVEIQTEPEAKTRLDSAGRGGHGGESKQERYESDVPDVRKAGEVDEDDDDGFGEDDDMDYDAEVAIWVDEASKCFGAQSEATHAVGLIAKLLMQRLPGMIAGIMADMLTPEVGESPFKSPVKSRSKATPASPGDSWKYLVHSGHGSASDMGQTVSPTRGSPLRQAVSEWGTAISPSQSRSPPRNVVGGGVEELLGEDEEEEEGGGGGRGMPSLDELKLRALSQAQQGLALATPQGLARMQSSTVCTETATVAKAVCILLGLKGETSRDTPCRLLARGGATLLRVMRRFDVTSVTPQMLRELRPLLADRGVLPAAGRADATTTGLRIWAISIDAFARACGVEPATGTMRGRASQAQTRPRTAAETRPRTAAAGFRGSSPALATFARPSSAPPGRTASKSRAGGGAAPMSGKSLGGLVAGSRLMRPLARTSASSGGAASVRSRVSGGLPNRIAAAYGSVPGGRSGVRPKTGASTKAGREVPGLDEARKLLQQIAPADLNFLRSMPKPTKGVALTMEAVCIILGLPTSWDYARGVLYQEGILRHFQLIRRESLHPDIMRLLRNHVKDPAMAISSVTRVNKAAGIIATWIHAFAKRGDISADEHAHMYQQHEDGPGTPLSADSLKGSSKSKAPLDIESDEVKSALIDIIGTRRYGL